MLESVCCAAYNRGMEREPMQRDAANPDAWDVCVCDHYRAEHDPTSGQCETVVIAAGRERNCVCRGFRFQRKRRTA